MARPLSVTFGLNPQKRFEDFQFQLGEQVVMTLTFREADGKEYAVTVSGNVFDISEMTNMVGESSNATHG